MSMKVIIGPNGCGKSRYVEQLLRTYDGTRRSVRYLTFRDTYGAADAGYYLQQRFNSSEHDEVPTVREALGNYEPSVMQQKVFELFGLGRLMDEQLIVLSSGELRKFQLAKALLGQPRMLIIDNPYIGLDIEARMQMTNLLGDLTTLGDLEVVLVVARESDIPPCATDIMRMAPATYPERTDIPTSLPCTAVAVPSHEVVRLNHVTIRYGRNTILNDISWTVHAGEKWALEGPNGSGKSTLLSIICADIPQAYACDVTLFDRQRGTGESIWDIKSHIGFVSPELHRAYRHDVAVTDVVASGLHDKKGLYVRTLPEQLPICTQWLSVLGMGHLADRRYLQLSSGEQRMVLLARAFVKDPDLLILDEPLHGLDDNNRTKVIQVIDDFCQRPGKTLIMVSHYAEDFPPCITHHFRLSR